MGRRRTRDAGLTLVELLVAMGIFAVVVSVFMTSLVLMTQNTTRVQVVADSADELRRVFQRMDKEVRSASSINTPGAGSVPTSVYVEYRTTAVPSGESPLCTQWRYDSVTSVLERRTWLDVASATATGWTTMATRIRNDLTASPAQQPFTLLSANSVNVYQRLSVELYAGKLPGSSAEAAVVRSVFAARNSSITSGTSVCLATGGRE